MKWTDPVHSSLAMRRLEVRRGREKGILSLDSITARIIIRVSFDYIAFVLPIAGLLFRILCGHCSSVQSRISQCFLCLNFPLRRGTQPKTRLDLPADGRWTGRPAHERNSHQTGKMGRRTHVSLPTTRSASDQNACPSRKTPLCNS